MLSTNQTNISKIDDWPTLFSVAPTRICSIKHDWCWAEYENQPQVDDCLTRPPLFHLPVNLKTCSYNYGCYIDTVLYCMYVRMQ